MSLIEREYEFSVGAPRDEVFALLSDARNLNDVTPDWFEFEILGANAGEMGQGAAIDYWLRWRLLKFRWRSRISGWDPPEFFAYEQARGPFRHFTHEHYFLEHGDGTRVVDRVIYSPPGGQFVDRLLVTSDLRRIFSFREEKVVASMSR